MKHVSPTNVFTLTIIIVLSVAQSTLSQPKSFISTTSISPVSRQTPVFIENRGQWDKQARFHASLPNASVWLTADGVRFELLKPIESPKVASKKGASASSRFDPLSAQRLDSQVDPREEQPKIQYERLVVATQFEGANQTAQIIGVGQLPAKYNYFTGSDPTNWQTNVPSFSSVTYEKIYQNIDLRYFHNGQNLEYEFIAAPGADLSQIKIRYEGIESLSINSAGDLEVRSADGVVMRELSPLLYQNIDGAKIEMRGSFKLSTNHTFSILPPKEYDESRALTIDPIVIFDKVFGGTSRDSGEDVAVDAAGDIYITGSTWSANFPIVGGFDPTFAGAWYNGGDAFISKLSGVDHSLIYSSFIGGTANDTTSHNGDDWAAAIALDQTGAAYITGRTYAEDFPTINAFQSTHIGGGRSTPFISKVSPLGDELVYSTFLDGTGPSGAYGLSTSYDITVDQFGSAVVVGFTQTSDFPLMNPLDATLDGRDDAFVTKFSPAGNELLYSTLLGGSSLDVALKVALDDLGQIVISGYTWSSDYPLVNEFQGASPLIGPNESDVFVTRISADGTSLIHSSYLGGSIQEIPFGMALGPDGSVNITGVTNSTDFTSLNPIDASPQDRFAARINSTGALQYSTYLADAGGAIAVDELGFTYTTGYYTNLYGYFLNKLSPDGNCLIRKDVLDADTTTYPSYHVNAITIGSDRTVYLVGLKLNSGSVSAFDVFLTTIAPSPDYVCGDADNSCSMNIADVTFMIARVFSGGPAPVITDAADANGDGTVNIADVTAMIATIFTGGPMPLCGTSGF